MHRPALVVLCFAAASMLAGCTDGDREPLHALASSQWTGAGEVEVRLGLYDAGWRSATCDCSIEVQVGDVRFGPFEAQRSDFHAVSSGTAPLWTVTVPMAQVGPCHGVELWHSLSIHVTGGGRPLAATGFVACGP